MKTLIFLLSFLPVTTIAQDMLLLDRNFRSPVEVVNADTDSNVEGQLFPLYNADLDSIITFTQELITQFDISRNVPSESYIKQFGHSYFIAQASQNGTLTQYYIRLITRSGNTNYAIRLIDKEDGQKRRVQKLKVFLDYLRNNRVLASGHKEL